MNTKRLLYGFAGLLATITAAWAATQTLTLGANTGPGGILTLFGSTSGSVTVQTAAAAGTGTVFQLPATNGVSGQFLQTNGSGVASWQTASGSGTVTSVTCGTGLTGGTFTTTGTCAIDAATLATGTSVTLTAPRQYYVCTGTCTVTPPVPAAGDEFCVMNDDNVATVITLAAIGSSARYENTARTAYGTAGTGTLVSGGAAGDKVCIVGRDSTHYLTLSFNGSWTAN